MHSIHKHRDAKATRDRNSELNDEEKKKHICTCGVDGQCVFSISFARTHATAGIGFYAKQRNTEATTAVCERKKSTRKTHNMHEDTSVRVKKKS